MLGAVGSGAVGGGAVQPKPFKIWCRDEGYCLAVRHGSLVLAPADSGDDHQLWFKDMRFSMLAQDEEGNPAFSLVNKPTGLAIAHHRGPFHPVALVPFNPDHPHSSVMWTRCGGGGGDGDGFGCIRALADICLKLGAFPGATVRLSDSDSCDHHWKILLWSDPVADEVGSAEGASRLCCKTVGDGWSVAARNGSVCLAPTDPCDGHQHWVQDTRDMIKDIDGYPAFALVNRVTGEAIRRPKYVDDPVKLVPYNPNYVDTSVLWSTSADMRHGFGCINPVDGIKFTLGVKDMQNGFEVVLSKRHEGDKQLWMMDLV